MDVAKPYSRACGFTLVEAMFTLAASVTLLSLSVPALDESIAQQRIISAAHQLTGHIHYARQQAIISLTTTTLCPTLDNENCTTDYTQWGNAYMIFSDIDQDRKRDNNESILRIVTSNQADIAVYSSKGRRSIKFYPTGSSYGSNLTLRICSKKNSSINRALILNMNGRLRSSNVLPSGKPILCNN